MPDVLSQNQIDELLSDLIQEELGLVKPEATKYSGVKNYDFKSPKKLSKEQLKTLTGIYENFARHLASYFSGILRILCEVSVTSIEEQPYYEYNNSLPDTLLIGVLGAKPIEGNVLVDMSNNISFTLIDRMLGGSGKSVMPNREFTEIEISLMERIFRQITQFTKESWSGLLGLECSFKQVETNARLIQSMAMDEVVVIILMDVLIGEVHGTLSFCIPCINLESIIDQLNRSRYQNKRTMDLELENTAKEIMVKHVKASSLELEGVFGNTVLTLREVMNLQVGDVISFDQSVDKKIKLKIGERTWFLGTPGVYRNKKAVKICKVL